MLTQLEEKLPWPWVVKGTALNHRPHRLRFPAVPRASGIMSSFRTEGQESFRKEKPSVPLTGMSRCVREAGRAWDLSVEGRVRDTPEMAPPSWETSRGLQGSSAISAFTALGLGCNTDPLGHGGHHEPGHLHPHGRLNASFSVFF